MFQQLSYGFLATRASLSVFLVTSMYVLPCWTRSSMWWQQMKSLSIGQKMVPGFTVIRYRVFLLRPVRFSWIFPIRSSSLEINILCNSFDFEVDFEFRLFLYRWLSTPLQFPGAGQFRVVGWVTFCSSFRASFVVPGSNTLWGVLLLLLLLLRLPGTLEYYFLCGTRCREFFKGTFFSLYEKSLCRCNLPAQSRTHSRHEIWFVRTVDLCPVLGLEWSSTDSASTRFPLAVMVYFSRLWEIIAKKLFIWNVTEWVSEAWRRWSVFFLSFLVLQRRVLTWGLKWHHKSILRETSILSIVYGTATWPINSGHWQCSHQCVSLNSTNVKWDTSGNLENTGTFMLLLPW